MVLDYPTQESRRKKEKQETRIEGAGASGALTWEGWSTESYCEEQNYKESVCGAHIPQNCQ